MHRKLQSLVVFFIFFFFLKPSFFFISSSFRLSSLLLFVCLLALEELWGPSAFLLRPLNIFLPLFFRPNIRSADVPSETFLFGPAPSRGQRFCLAIPSYEEALAPESPGAGGSFL